MPAGLRLVRVRRVALLTVVALVACGGTADARFLGSGEDTSSSPYAFVISKDLKRPKWVRVEFTASPFAPTYASFTVSCSRGFSSRRVEVQVSDVLGAYVRYPTLGKADECYVSASIEYESLEQAGTVRVVVYGESKRKPR